MLEYCYRYPHPAVTADCVIFGAGDEQIKILLVRRGSEPYKGYWAFPGGFMNIDETAEDCALRELEEETGLRGVSLRQFCTCSRVDRDPRERVVSVVHYAFVTVSDIRAGDDASDARWFALDGIPPLAFDHAGILYYAVRKLRRELYPGYGNHQGPYRLYTPEMITELLPGEIFVFGSNLEGSHGGGAALTAYRKFGAVWGQGTGLQGQSYGIPTMHGGVEDIKPYADEFISFAARHPEMEFLVTKVGCGIAGFRSEEIAPLFSGAAGLPNVLLPREFVIDL